MKPVKRIVAACSIELALRLRLHPIEAAELPKIKVDHISICADDGTLWLWPLVSTRKASNSPCP